MTDETIFTADPAAVAPVTPNPDVAAAAVAPVAQAQPVVPPELAELVGEGKKFKTVEAAYQALPHQVSHISKIELENSQMREELTRRKTAEELLVDMRQNAAPPAVTPAGVEVNANVVSEIVKQQLAATKLEDVQSANTASVVNAFRTNFSEKAETVYNKLAQDNGMSVADINALAARAPQAVLNLAGLQNKPAPAPTFSSDVNPLALGQNSAPTIGNARVTNYGNSKDVADGMRRAKEIVALKLN